MSRDIHKKAFDEGTKAKLAIFNDYLKEWLPVFLARNEIIWNTINIFDFFAGPGSDSSNTSGSPLIILDELQPYFDKIITKKLNVNLYFNEYDTKKYEELISKVLPDDRDLHPYSITVESLDFKIAFEKYYPKMSDKNSANLLFLDQTGIKQINEDIFQKIINLKQTDFLFFISSSTIKRFSEHPAILKYFKLDQSEIEKTPYHKIHRLVLEYYRSLIPVGKNFHLAPFSLKKNAGIYGLIFGSSHLLGIEKFISTCWGIDKERGEANFDIDDDNLKQGQFDLFTGKVAKPKKVDFFEKDFETKILSGELQTDSDIYMFTLLNGFLPEHARNIIKKMIINRKIEKISLNLNHNSCKKNAILNRIKVL